MRSSLETSSFRVFVLASGLAMLSAACASSSGKPNPGTGGSSADGGTDVKADSGTGGKTDSGTDSGAGGRVDSGSDSADGKVDSGAGGMGMVDAGTGGSTLNPPWHAYWPLVMGTPSSTSGMGTTPDISGNQYEATYYGATFATGAVNLIGNNSQEVVVPPKGGVPAVDVTGSYSVQAWVTLSNVGVFETVVSGEGINIASFFLQKRVDNGGAWYFTTQAGDSTASANCISPPLQPVDGGPAANPVVVVANTLYHLVATRDGTSGTQILYVNGVESGRNTCPAGFVDTGYLGIGHGFFAGGRTDFVNGSISDVGVINRVLTPAEVTMLYNKGRTYVPPDAGPDVAPDAPADVPANNDGGEDGG